MNRHFKYIIFGLLVAGKAYCQSEETSRFSPQEISGNSRPVSACMRRSRETTSEMRKVAMFWIMPFTDIAASVFMAD